MAEEDEIGMVIETVQKLNYAWRHGLEDELRPCLHANMVMVSPDYSQRLAGRDACAESYLDFFQMASIKEYIETDYSVDLFTGTAVVHYHFEMTYEMNDRLYRESGRDLLFLTQENGIWQVIWRTVQPDQACRLD